ncbi:hypothetical protein EEX84_08975 [Planococcus salinus]|uniref:Uncharacterized protein n=1 Tax=Planococcus salinus TaxID=1848460 RepID=A0A3M8P7E4_9BACL|nr:hypothetical protein [Planococcus salinus]RNF39595.1 hypothetical protein EEX84_08975 [Planococcus salinus]
MKEYHYILPKDKRELNFLSAYRHETENYVKAEKIKLHQFFHHLNSSQAMCLNFFYPLIVEHQLSLVLKVLNLPDEQIEEAAFEHILPGGEKTNFDFYMKLKSGKEILFEIKYMEKGFGKSTSCETLERQYQNVYREMLTGKIRSGVDELEALGKNYQLLRNIAHLEWGDERLLVNICPGQNLKLHKEYKNVMDKIVVPELHKNIRMVTWESLLERMNDQLEEHPSFSNKLEKHYKEFEEKYLQVQ